MVIEMSSVIKESCESISDGELRKKLETVGKILEEKGIYTIENLEDAEIKKHYRTGWTY